MKLKRKKKIGSRSYCNYTKEKLQAAVDEIKEKKISDFMNNENAEAQLITPSIDEDNIPDGTQPSTSGHKTNSDTDEISEDEIFEENIWFNIKYFDLNFLP
ncbi:hypothetical protein QE152_g13373 [Popillia japonica]|uniref:Uncharacterized protein n=1 Tax=Popillia japonica TaxID=7064 RepID=A0AAW1LF27_POPJA